MDLLISNIRYLRSKTGLNQADFAVLFGLNRQQVASYEENRAIPKIEVLFKIANYFSISLDLMAKYDFDKLEGAGLLFYEIDEDDNLILRIDDAVITKLQPAELNILRESFDNYTTQTGIPLVNVAAMGGFGNAEFKIEKQNVVGYYNIPEFKSADFFIPMKGKSMLPYYPHGAILACKIVSEESYIQWGKPYLIATKGQGLIVKRITKGKNAKFWTLVSDNDKLFQPHPIPVSEVDGIALILGCATLYFE